MDIGGKIRRARRNRELSQMELAEVLNRDKSFISSVERGKRPIKTEMLEKIAETLEVPISYFYDSEDSTDANDELTDRVIRRLEKRGYIIRKPEEEEEIPPDIREVVKAMKDNPSFNEFCKAAKKLINRSYALPNAAELLNIFVESLDEAHRREAEGRSDF